MCAYTTPKICHHLGVTRVSQVGTAFACWACPNVQHSPRRPLSDAQAHVTESRPPGPYPSLYLLLFPETEHLKVFESRRRVPTSNYKSNATSNGACQGAGRGSGAAAWPAQTHAGCLSVNNSRCCSAPVLAIVARLFYDSIVPPRVGAADLDRGVRSPKTCTRRIKSSHTTFAPAPGMPLKNAAQSQSIQRALVMAS
ncbi:unnamed protein product [Spodoptera exigua]|nr:unnamed protein product [Spodoptera exigua]